MEWPVMGTIFLVYIVKSQWEYNSVFSSLAMLARSELHE